MYFLFLESRSTAAGEYSCNFSITSSSDYEKNTISSFPHSNTYTSDNHATAAYSHIFGAAEDESRDAYRVSIFEFSHEAGSVFSYKLNTTESSVAPYAAVMSYDGDVYTPHISKTGEGYACGDAIELSYSASSYLFVFSDGEFTLQADMLVHNEYVIEKLAPKFSGNINISDSSPMYDSDKIAALAADFPFSDIKNRNVKFFSVDCTPSSVVSFLCDRGEHKYLTIVSDEIGLSHSSVYPMRKFGEYCSEIDPCMYCYSAYINDGSSYYICYTGTGTEAYISLQSSPTHKSSFVPAEKYAPEDILTPGQIQDIYSDSDIYIKLAIDKVFPDLMRAGGYMLEDESKNRYYYAYGSDITVPYVDGKVKLYAVIECTYSEDDGKRAEHYSFLVGEINVERGFIKQVFKDVSDYVSANPIGIVIIFVACGAIVGAGVYYAVPYIKKHKLYENGENKAKEDGDTDGDI